MNSIQFISLIQHNPMGFDFETKQANEILFWNNPFLNLREITLENSIVAFFQRVKP